MKFMLEFEDDPEFPETEDHLVKYIRKCFGLLSTVDIYRVEDDGNIRYIPWKSPNV